jgi:hypothetical protein
MLGRAPLLEMMQRQAEASMLWRAVIIPWTWHGPASWRMDPVQRRAADAWRRGDAHRDAQAEAVAPTPDDEVSVVERQTWRTRPTGQERRRRPARRAAPQAV